MRGWIYPLTTDNALRRSVVSKTLLAKSAYSDHVKVLNAFAAISGTYSIV